MNNKLDTIPVEEQIKMLGFGHIMTKEEIDNYNKINPDYEFCDDDESCDESCNE